jgi:hypothetical protein
VNVNFGGDACGDGNEGNESTSTTVGSFVQGS